MANQQWRQAILAREMTRSQKSETEGHTVNEDVEGRIWNMWAARKQDESCSRNAAVSNTTHPISGSRGICHPIHQRSQVIENAAKYQKLLVQMSSQI